MGEEIFHWTKIKGEKKSHMNVFVRMQWEKNTHTHTPISEVRMLENSSNRYTSRCIFNSEFNAINYKKMMHRWRRNTNFISIEWTRNLLRLQGFHSSVNKWYFSVDCDSMLLDNRGERTSDDVFESNELREDNSFGYFLVRNHILFVVAFPLVSTGFVNGNARLASSSLETWVMIDDKSISFDVLLMMARERDWI